MSNTTTPQQLYTPYQYDCALVCSDVPKSAVNGLSLESEEKRELVDAALASRQHKSYIQALKDAGIQVFEVQPDEAFPDCVFVEDTAIAIGNRVFISNPGAESRRGEVDRLIPKWTELSERLNLKIFTVAQENKAEAFIDGGDVLFTGKELVVGVSTRTNHKGIDELQKAFSEINIVRCDLLNGLHLKCFVTMLTTSTIMIGVSSAAQHIRKQIEEKSKHLDSFKFVEITEDDVGSANVLLLNDWLFFNQAFESLYSSSKNLHLHEEFAKFKQSNRAKSLENSELAKIDGALTCRSVLFCSGKPTTN